MTDIYVDTDDFKSYMGISSTADDDQIDLAVEVASRQIDDAAGRVFTQPAADATQRIFTVSNIYEIISDDIADVDRSTVTVEASFDTVVWYDAADGWYLTPRDARYRRTEPFPFTGVASNPFVVPFISQIFVGNWIRITAHFGWPSAPPAAVRRATMIQAARTFKRKDSPTGIESYADFSRKVSSDAIDPDADLLISPYKRFDRRVGFA